MLSHSNNYMTRLHIYYKYNMNTMKFQNMINIINNMW